MLDKEAYTSAIAQLSQLITFGPISQLGDYEEGVGVRAGWVFNTCTKWLTK